MVFKRNWMELQDTLAQSIDLDGLLLHQLEIRFQIGLLPLLDSAYVAEVREVKSAIQLKVGVQVIRFNIDFGSKQDLLI